MRKDPNIITIFLFFIFTLISFHNIQAQNNLFSGTQVFGGREGTANYEYIFANGKSIMEGPFQFTAADSSFTVSGYYKNDRKDSLWQYIYEYPNEDVLRAIRYVRFNADRFGIDPNKIAVLGFSAGGHLANSAMCVFDYGRDDGDEIDKVSSRPDGVVLCYGVISLKKYTHAGSKDVLIGGLENEEELANKMSGELAVKEDTPPCFIWHTQDDQAVPVWNSLDLYSALTKQGISAALHVFPHGQHGLGLAKDKNDVSKWSELLGCWLINEGFSK